MNALPRKTSIAVTVGLALVTVTTLVLVTLGVVSYRHTSDQELEKLRVALALDADQLAPNLDLPVWNFDHPEIDKVVESMMVDPVLQSIVVSATDGQKVLCARERDAQGNIRPLQAASPASGFLVEKRSIIFAGETLATVTLVGTTKSIEGRQKNLLAWVFYNILWVDSALFLGVFLLLHRWVFKPLQEIEAYAAAVSVGGSARLVRTFQGELEGLRASIEKMFRLLSARYLELQESGEKFSKAFQANPSGLAITELETGCYLEVNESFYRMYGYSREEMIGRTSMELGVWKDAEHRDWFIRQLRIVGTVRDYEMESRTRGGDTKTLLVNAERIELRGRLCVVSLLQDITERKRAVVALIQSEERFSRIFRSNPMPITLTRLADGLFLDVNEGFLRFSGYTRDEVVGRTVLELKLYEHDTQRALVLGQLQQHGHLHDHEQLFRTKSGQFRNQLLWFELLTFSGEQCILTITWDITERKQAAARERQAKDAFTQKLIASQEAERSRIASELHDSLGQNLILIKHRAQIGLDLAEASPTVRDQFQGLQDMAARAIAEVRHISHDLRPYQLDRLGLVRALATMIDGAAENSRLPIAHKLDPVDDLFSAEAATHLYRIAQESISNILKHAQARSAKVGLERDVHDVRLWIEDDGRGFPMATGQSGLPGGGLGLSSMAERVQMLGGTLRIESRPGQGTRIEVTIPHAGGT